MHIQKSLITNCPSAIKIFGKFLFITNTDGISVWEFIESQDTTIKLNYLYDIYTDNDSMPFIDFQDNFLLTGDQQVL